MSHSVRKIVKVGTSTAVVIPPHVLSHIGAERGDFMIFDITMKNFAIISLAPIPPYGEIAEQEDESIKDTPAIPPPGGASLDPRLKAANQRADLYGLCSDGPPDARPDSEPSSDSTSTKTEPTVQAPFAGDSPLGLVDDRDAVDHDDLAAVHKETNLPVLSRTVINADD